MRADCFMNQAGVELQELSRQLIPGSSCIQVQKRDRLRRLIEIVLALVLIAAALLKAYQLFSYSIYFPSSRILSPKFQAMFIQAEFLLGIWLVTGGLPRLRFFTTLLCFSVFSGVTAWETLHSMLSCGCFGFVTVPPWMTLMFDLSAVIGLWLTRQRNISLGDVSPSGIRLVGGVTFASLSALVLWSVYFSKTQEARADANLSSLTTGSLVVLNPAAMLHKPFSLFGEIQRANELKKGKWLVIFYHYDCDICLQAIPHYQSLAVAQSNSVDQERIAFVAIPPIAPHGEDTIAPSSFYLHLSLRPDHQWLAMTPLVVALKDGIVIAAVQGEQAVEPMIITSWR
jgi:hypothetical protein